MIIVTGTKRSGTSMWMQALIAAGFPHIGEAFPGAWETFLKDANPRGFFESRLRQGIYYATNPLRPSGIFLHPEATRRHAVKVFIPGVVRTDYAFLGRVLATMRDWREYTLSLTRMYEFEDRFTALRPLRDGETESDREAEAAQRRVHRGVLPPAVEWWFENYALVRDVAVRRYPYHLVTYRRLLEDPEEEIGKVIRWIGEGDAAGAAAAIDRTLRTQAHGVVENPGVDAEAIAVFDELHDVVHRQGMLLPDLLSRMNALQARLDAEWKGRSRRNDELPDAG